MKVDLADLQNEVRKRKGKKVIVGPSSKKKDPTAPQTSTAVVEVAGGAATGAETDLLRGSVDQEMVAGGEAERWPSFEEEEEKEDSSAQLVSQKRKQPEDSLGYHGHHGHHG